MEESRGSANKKTIAEELTETGVGGFDGPPVIKKAKESRIQDAEAAEEIGTRTASTIRNSNLAKVHRSPR